MFLSENKHVIRNYSRDEDYNFISLKGYWFECSKVFLQIYDWWTLYVHTCSRCNHHIYPIYIRGRKTNREGFLLLTRVLFSYLNIFFNYIYTYLNTIGKLRIYSYLNCTQMRHSIGKMINDMWFKVDIYLNKYISLESSTMLYVLYIWVRYGRGIKFRIV